MCSLGHLGRRRLRGPLLCSTAPGVAPFAPSGVEEASRGTCASEGPSGDVGGQRPRRRRQRSQIASASRTHDGSDKVAEEERPRVPSASPRRRRRQKWQRPRGVCGAEPQLRAANCLGDSAAAGLCGAHVDSRRGRRWDGGGVSGRPSKPAAAVRLRTCSALIVRAQRGRGESWRQRAVASPARDSGASRHRPAVGSQRRAPWLPCAS